VLEDHLIRPAVVQHERKPIEVLDAPFDFAAVHHPDRHVEPLAADEVEKDVLNVRLAGFGVRGRHRATVRRGTA
jgi:hypothetical protein